jgi:hypothetical protein
MRPTQVEDTWEATVVETTKLRYVIEADDFVDPGEYLVQANVALPAWQGRGETYVITVYAHYAR